MTDRLAGTGDHVDRNVDRKLDRTGDHVDRTVDGAAGGDADRAPDGAAGSVPSRWAAWRATRRDRVSRWDRPPEPHDWRFYVGTLGKVLIATGLLMFGFVAYQLWGTGIETARAQNALKDQFEQVLAERQAGRGAPPATAPADEPVDEPASTTGGDTDRPGDEPTTGTTEPPADEDGPDGEPPAVDLAARAVDQEIPAFERGDALALLEIPAIGRSDIVLPGVDLDDLKNGPGHYPDTPLPGQLGNAAIAGHRTTYGAPFFDVDQLRPGDEIIVTMLTGDRFVYRVTGSEIVSASDYWVVTTSDPTVAELTLTSCHPKYTARERIVVRSVLDPERSAAVGIPEFYDLDEPADDGTDEPTVETTTATTDAPTGDDPTIDPDGDPVAAADDPGDTGRGPGEPRPAAAEPEDVFSEGWFHDPAAFPQIALWAAALTIVSLLAYRLSRRTRHTSVGVLVGIVPFVVALYFFYQNVNRLLPPGL